jgi:hypothetical protein
LNYEKQEGREGGRKRGREGRKGGREVREGGRKEERKGGRPQTGIPYNPRHILMQISIFILLPCHTCHA